MEDVYLIFIQLTHCRVVAEPQRIPEIYFFQRCWAFRAHFYKRRSPSFVKATRKGRQIFATAFLVTATIQIARPRDQVTLTVAVELNASLIVGSTR